MLCLISYEKRNSALCCKLKTDVVVLMQVQRKLLLMLLMQIESLNLKNSQLSQNTIQQIIFDALNPWKGGGIFSISLNFNQTFIAEFLNNILFL